YNSGVGSTATPTGITEATDVIAYFPFDEGTGATADNSCTLGAGNDMTLSGGYTWDTPLINGVVQLHSFGVAIDAYPAGQVTDKFFTIQFPHKKLLRDVPSGVTGLIYPHVHWYGEDLTAGDVVWKLEYTWNHAGLSLPYCQIVERVIANDTVGDPANSNRPIQRMNNLPSAGIEPPMSAENVSSTMACRLYRDGSDSRDTYAGKAYLHEFDAHFEIDTIGSRLAGSK
ncbi:MAG: hypothetical protein DSY80_00095, partial [Desulfocapsa sp.]